MLVLSLQSSYDFLDRREQSYIASKSMMVPSKVLEKKFMGTDNLFAPTDKQGGNTL